MLVCRYLALGITSDLPLVGLVDKQQNMHSLYSFLFLSNYGAPVSLTQLRVGGCWNVGLRPCQEAVPSKESTDGELATRVGEGKVFSAQYTNFRLPA